MTSKDRVLVVDDEPMNITVMREILKSEYSVLASTRASAALAVAKSATPPEVILLDINMPEMDGFELLRRLKADPVTRGIPVILVTGRDTIDDKLAGYELGGADYITKPVDPSFVRSVVRRVLRKE